MNRSFDDFADKIIFAFSTRKGGVSEGPYESLNLSFSMGDDPAKVFRNYEIWCDSLGVDPHATVMLSQTHSDHIIRVDKSHCGHGLFRERIPDTDAMVTNVKGVALATGHADCVPVYLYDPVNEAIGLAHAGWRGTTKEIAGKTIDQMVAEFGSDPAEMFAMIGPCISIRRFECDRDVIDAVHAMGITLCPDPAQDTEDRCVGVDGSLVYYYDKTTAKFHVSLANLNRLVLMSRGIPAEHIDMRDACTYDDPETYFSHRRDGMARGGQQALLMMRE